MKEEDWVMEGVLRELPAGPNDTGMPTNRLLWLATLRTQRPPANAGVFAVGQSCSSYPALISSFGCEFAKPNRLDPQLPESRR